MPQVTTAKPKHTWTWADDSTYSFERWKGDGSSGEPDEISGYCAKFGQYWLDKLCTSKEAVVCEMPSNGESLILSVSPDFKLQISEKNIQGS